MLPAQVRNRDTALSLADHTHDLCVSKATTLHQNLLNSYAEKILIQKSLFLWGDYHGARLREGLLDKTNTASSVWADTAYRSKANEDFMEKQGFVSKVHRKKPHLKPMPRHIQKSNAGKSVIRSRVEHVFADQKSQTGLFVRTVGISRATMRIGLANIVYNMRRLLFLERLNASA